MWLKKYFWSDKNFKNYESVDKHFLNFELPSASSSSGDNRNLNFEFSLSLVRDYLPKFTIFECPQGSSKMGHRLMGMYFICWQCFCPILNGVTPKIISCNNCGHWFRECNRVEDGCCDLSSQHGVWLLMFCWLHEQACVLLTVMPCNSYVGESKRCWASRSVEHEQARSCHQQNISNQTPH